MLSPFKNFFNCTIFSTNELVASKPRLRQNFASEIVTECKNDHNQKPEKPRTDEDPGEARAVAHVHEIKHDQQRFAGGNGHGDVNIQPTGVVKGHINGDKREQLQRDEDQNVNFLGNDGVL